MASKVRLVKCARCNEPTDAVVRSRVNPRQLVCFFCFTDESAPVTSLQTPGSGDE